MDNNLNNQIEIEEEKTETITAPAVEEQPAEEARSNETPTQPDEPKKSRKRIVIPTVCASVFLLSVGILGATFVSATTEPITVEVGETPQPEKIHDNEILSALYAVEPYTIDVTKPGDHEIGLRFFGFLPGEVIVEVRDTTPPELTLTDVHTVEGTVIGWEDFVLSWTDATDVSIEAAEFSTETAGEYTVTLTAADESGNKTTADAGLTVWDSTHILAAELNAADLESTMRAKHPEVTEMDLSDISTGVIGEYILHASSETAAYVWPVKVSDTTPPKVESRRLAIRPGVPVTAEDFVVSVDEVSEYSVSFTEEPDFARQGQQMVHFAAEDIHGNRTDKTARLFIADFPTELNLEYGISAEDVTKAVFADAPFEKQFTLSDAPTEIGEYELTLDGTFGSYTVKLNIADTTPPVLKLTDATVYVGDDIQLEYFVVSAEDLSHVTCSFSDGLPSSDEAGDFTVHIDAADVHGNQSGGQTTLHVITDTTAPVIYGVSDKTIVVGESVSFKKNVYAVDDRDGDVTFKVDSSAVNTGVPGTYPVTYTAVDSSGNEAKVTVYLSVIRITMDTVNSLADNILWKITNSTMTQRDKAWAIYQWCTSSLTYSTRTSYLMGNYIDGAYSGFTIRSGNCYIYYAVSSALLTRAGIENLMVQRDDPANPHYWSLVNIDGSWYHFDTCPHYAGHEMQCFLLTDAEVKAYSDNEVADYYSFDTSLYPATPR